MVVWRVQSKDYFGMTGLMAALEKGRLEVVKRLFGVGEIHKDFTQTNMKGRNALDMMIASPVDYLMPYILRELASRLVKKGELEKLLLPRLLS